MKENKISGIFLVKRNKKESVLGMINKIITVFFGLSILFSIINNTVPEMSSSLLNSSDMAIKTVISLMGGMALWGGVMEIAKSSGLTEKVCNLVKKPVKFLFPKLDETSSAFEAIAMNITANLLGLGNAATPLGLKAMKELSKEKKSKEFMATLVVLNSASIQLIPITVATLRMANGSQSPWDFVPSVLIVSILALSAGIIMIKILNFKR